MNGGRESRETSCRTGELGLLYKEDWDEARAKYEAWFRGEDIGRPLVQVTAPRKGDHPKSAWRDRGLASHPDDPEWCVEEFEKRVQATYFGGEALPYHWIDIGSGSLAAFLGCEVVVREDEQTVWFEPPRDLSLNEIAQLELDPENSSTDTLDIPANGAIVFL